MEDSEGFTQVAIGTEGANRAFSNVGPQKHGLFVQFYMHPRQSEAKSTEAGRPIYDETEYIRIMVPGDKASIVERPVRLGIHVNADNQKFSAEYSAFRANKEQTEVGTPLAEWPPISRSQVKEMAYFNVRTVEQLAGMADSHIQKFAGLLKLRNLAQRFIEHADAAAPLSKMQGELDASTASINALIQQVKAQADELAVLKGNTVAAAPVVEAPVATYKQPTPSVTTPIEDEPDADSAYASAPLNLSVDEDVVEQKAAESNPAAKKRRAIAN